MKKNLLLPLFLLLILPLSVRAEAGTDVKTVNATINNNTINFTGTTQDNSVAVMCKLLDNNNEEIDKLSVEVDNKTFEGSFITTETGTYTVACANYEGGTIVTDEVAVTTMETYTVTYNTNGGSTITEATVEHGQTLEQPADPTKNDMSFAGWYIDSTLTTPYDFSTKVTANFTLYAAWTDTNEPVNAVQVQTIFFGEGGTYQVDFAADDSINSEPLGEPVNSSHRYFVTEGEAVTLTAIPANGYHFKGWYKTHEINGNEWVLDELLSTNTTYEFTPVDFANIQVVFEENNGPETHTVTFNTNGGSTINPIQVEDGQQLQLPANPTKDNHVFLDWYVDSTLTTWFDPSQEIHSSFTLYAKWHEGQAREADQLQIWAATGGTVAAEYTPSNPNVYELNIKDGTEFVEHGEVVQFYVGDQVTAIAKAKEGYKFVGWKHVDIEYGPDNPSEEHPSACMGEVFATTATYTYTPKVTVIDGDDEPIKYVCADFVEDDEEEPKEINNGDEKYTLSEDNVTISFTDVAGQTFSIEISDYTKMTDEELSLQDPPMTREEYNAAKEMLAEAVKKQGTLLSILEINIYDNQHEPVEEGPFEIKIKLTEEMKKYNTFKLVNLESDDDGNLILGDIVELEVKGDYLVGTLPHLSAYILTGDITETTETTTATAKTPKTFDDILTWIVAFVISGIGLLFGAIKFAKAKK